MHTKKQLHLCRHNSRAWIHYWKWIRNLVDGQWTVCTVQSSSATLAMKKKYTATNRRCLWPQISFAFSKKRHEENTSEYYTKRLLHSRWRVPLCYSLFFLLRSIRLFIQVQAHHFKLANWLLYDFDTLSPIKLYAWEFSLRTQNIYHFVCNLCVYFTHSIWTNMLCKLKVVTALA